MSPRIQFQTTWKQKKKPVKKKPKKTKAWWIHTGHRLLLHFQNYKLAVAPYPQLSAFGRDGRWRMLRKSRNILGRTSFSMIIV